MAKNSVAQSDEASSTSSSSSTDDLIKDTDNKNVDKKQKKADISLNKKKSNKKIPVVEQKIGNNGLESQDLDESRHLRTRTAILLLLSIFALSLGALLFVYYSFPHLEK
jgi:hypothetical protein